MLVTEGEYMRHTICQGSSQHAVSQILAKGSVYKLRSTAMGKRLLSALVAGSLMLGAMVPISFAEQQPQEIQQGGNRIRNWNRSK